MDAEVPLLTLRNAKKVYGGRCVVSVENFVLYTHDTILVTGTNGSGKSTFLRILAGITPPTHGRLERSEKTNHLRIAFVPQAGGLYEDLTVAENLTLFSGLYGAKSFDQNLRWFVRDMGLAPFMEVRAAQLSGGLHKTAVLAATFLTNPDGLFLDEPASALDDHRTARLYEGLARLGETLTFLVITGQESAGINFVRRHLTMDNGHLE